VLTPTRHPDPRPRLGPRHLGMLDPPTPPPDRAANSGSSPPDASDASPDRTVTLLSRMGTVPCLCSSGPRRRDSRHRGCACCQPPRSRHAANGAAARRRCGVILAPARGADEAGLGDDGGASALWFCRATSRAGATGVSADVRHRGSSRPRGPDRTRCRPAGPRRCAPRRR
jgi:hypothetical protein